MKDNVIHVDFRRDYVDVLDYYRAMHGKKMEVAYSEKDNYFVLGLIDPRSEEMFIVDCGWID